MVVSIYLNRHVLVMPLLYLVSKIDKIRFMFFTKHLLAKLKIPW